MEKFCVFCGKRPESKNKEHIIPQWLIRMTGDPNRKINLGVDMSLFKKTGEFKMRSFDFKSFQFPACEKCNSNFSNLESKIQHSFEKILNKEYLNNLEISDILDWFDKVRIGLWLGFLMLDGFLQDVMPKFHINQRVGSRDRCLYIYELKDNGDKGIQFIGPNSPGFLHIPSCFSLRVNNIYFFNYSFDFLFSENIGFPYASSIANTDHIENKHLVSLEVGKGKISWPLLNEQLIEPALSIYQPMIPKEIIGTELQNKYYETNYVKNNCIDYVTGIGDIFYKEEKLMKLGEADDLKLYDNLQKLNPDTFPNIIAKPTYKVLEKLLKRKPHDSLLTVDQKETLNLNRLAVLKSHQLYVSYLNKKVK